jgi:S-adenosylmethionine:tRNA ribosyltransferase-isomerase
MTSSDEEKNLWRRSVDDVDLDDLDAYDYELDESLIADAPAARRDGARLLVYDGAEPTITHDRFHRLCDYLRADDLLVFNDTQVVPARLTVYKDTGGRVELFVLQPDQDASPGAWLEGTSGELVFQCMTRSSKPVRKDMLLADPDRPTMPSATVIDAEPGRARVRFDWQGSALEFLQAFGEVPLPPYIVKKRERAGDPTLCEADLKRYQTVYAAAPGAVAAPTAGLHFTDPLLEKVDAMGVNRAYVTLTVGPGTFQPVRSAKLSDHDMHFEEYFASPSLGQAIEACRRRGGRVIAVGTTSVRALESEARQENPFSGVWRSTNLFLRPGVSVEICDGVITNFHLPRSTLLALVAALAGYEAMRAIYESAVDEGYRFYSYGDSSLILPAP